MPGVFITNWCSRYLLFYVIVRNCCTANTIARGYTPTFCLQGAVFVRETTELHPKVCQHVVEGSSGLGENFHVESVRNRINRMQYWRGREIGNIPVFLLVTNTSIQKAVQSRNTRIYSWCSFQKAAGHGCARLQTNIYMYRQQYTAVQTVFQCTMLCFIRA